MRRHLQSVITATLLGSAGLGGSLNYHVLRTDNGIELLPKQELTLHDTFLDVRQLSLCEWKNHGSVMAAMIKAKKEHVLGTKEVQTVRREIDKLLDGAKR